MWRSVSNFQVLFTGYVSFDIISMLLQKSEALDLEILIVIASVRVIHESANYFEQ